MNLARRATPSRLWGGGCFSRSCMRVLSGLQPKAPTVDELDFKSLYRKSEYEVETADGWLLKITRYQPRRQAFDQPILDEPLLLVHGFSQNRHAWTCGQFA